MRSLPRPMLVALLVLAFGCGGGGAGGSEGNAVQVVLDHTEFSFAALTGMRTRQEFIRFTLMSPWQGTAYGVVVVSPAAGAEFSLSPVSETIANGRLSIVAPSTPGVTTGQVTFKLCDAPTCTNVMWSQTLPYTLTTFGVSTDSLTFQGYEGALTAPQLITVTPPDTAYQLVCGQVSGNFGILTQRDAPGCSVQLWGGRLGGGYSGAVSVGPPGGDMRMVSIVFDMAPAFAPVAQIEAVVGVGTPAASLAGAIPVVFRSDQAPTWTATSDHPWLVLDAAGGTGNASLGYHIDRTLLVGQWGEALAWVTIQAPWLAEGYVPVHLVQGSP